MMARLPGSSMAAATPCTARENQLAHVGRQTAPSRGRSEKNSAGDVYPFAAVDIAERSSGQHQCGKEERVCLNNPLHVDDSCVVGSMGSIFGLTGEVKNRILHAIMLIASGLASTFFPHSSFS
jgi:hypothetical protein